jgi:hypothetical protein
MGLIGVKLVNNFFCLPKKLVDLCDKGGFFLQLLLLIHDMKQYDTIWDNIQQTQIT